MTTYDLKFTANGAVIGLHEQITFQQRVWWCFRCRLNTWNRDWCRCTCADLPNRLLLCVHSPLQKTTQVTHFYRFDITLRWNCLRTQSGA